jgi:hypothetical protein
MVWNRKINPGKAFDLTLPLDEVAEGYRAMDDRRAIKAAEAIGRTVEEPPSRGYKSCAVAPMSLANHEERRECFRSHGWVGFFRARNSLRFR